MAERGSDDHYDATALLRPPPKRSLPASLHGLHASLGFQSQRRNNIKFIEDDVILRIEGNTVLILNLKTKEQRRIFGFDGEGIGAIAVHPSRKLFAVGEKGNWPNVYVYSYPSLKVFRVCRKGTERAFSDMQFNEAGDKLATVGSYPDYLLTVWDWKAERITLHTKAFAQEVFNCSFSPDNDGFLTTSGTGHIRFWKMASTFTGLKLQGDLGKFGKVELSDVEAYATLPDGKRLSATERGALLMWDGNLIKYELLLPGQKCPHNGNVTVIVLDREAGEFITAGTDGRILFWDYQTLDQADVGEDQTFVEIEPKRRIQLDGVSVREIVTRGKVGEGARWLLQDANSGLHWLDVDEEHLEPVLSSHAGPVVALAASPVDNFALTAGSDGAVRCWDYVGGTLMFEASFRRAATCAKWCPPELEGEARTAAVAFEDGVIRMLRRHKTEWRMSHCFKPHNGRINGVGWAPDARHFASVGEDGNLFVLRCPDDSSSEYAPVGFYPLGVAALCLDWRSDSEAILVGCADGTVVEAPLPDGMCDTSESYELDTHLRRRSVKPPPPRKSAAQLREEKAEAEAAAAAAAAAMADDPFAAAAEENAAADAAEAGEELDALPVTTIMYTPPASPDTASDEPPSTFIVSFEAETATDLYEFDWDGEQPSTCMPASPLSTCCASLSKSGRFIVSGAKNGQVCVRPTDALCGVLQITLHDGVVGRVGGAAVSFDDQFVISCGHDGHIFVSRILADELASEAKGADEKVRRKARMAKSAFQKTLTKVSDDKAKIIEDNKKEGAKPQPVPDPEYEAAVARAESEERADEEEEITPAVMPVVVTDDEAAQKRFGEVQSSLAADHHDTAAEASIVPATDITDDEQYSIQDAKLKTEADHQKDAAEKKKDGVRAQVEQLRAEFTALRQEVQALPKGQRIAEDDFVIEPGFFATLEKDRQQLLQEVHNEFEHPSERQQLAQAKLKGAFLDDVELEPVELRALKATRHVVRSIGCRALSKDMQEALVEAREYDDTQKKRAAEKAAEEAAEEAKLMAGSVVGDAVLGGAVAPGGSAEGEGTGYEVRKRLRQERRAMMEKVEQSKPSIDADDPKDVFAMQKALATMGDFKLKTADNYVVPEEDRVNADIKMRQRVLLAESFYQLRAGFNSRFLQMRDRKASIIVDVQRNNARITAINTELGESEDLWQPVETPSEYPERREQVTDDDVDALREGRARLAAAEKGDDYTPPAKAQAEDKAVGTFSPISIDAHQLACQSAVAQGLPCHMAAVLQAAPIGEESQLQAARADVHRRLLRFEREKLRKETATMVEHFDHDVAALCMERAKLWLQLQLGAMRQQVMAQEFKLLQDFESKDAALAAKLKKCTEDKKSVVAEIEGNTERLKQKEEELAVWKEKDALIMGEFSKLVGAGNQFEPQLLKMFKRKIKRAKKRAGDEDEDEDDEEDWEEESEEDEDDDDDDDDDEEDACPPGCDQTLYDKVLELREKRLDQEEILAEFQKAIDELNRTTDRHKNRQKQIDKDLKGSKSEIQLFQTEKQKKLNEIEICTPILFDQTFTTVPADPEAEEPGPPELLANSVEEAIIFGKGALERLRRRSKELVGENKALRSNYRELHKTKTRLEREKKQSVGEIATLEKRCEDLQMLKFGQKIDLQALDRAMETTSVDDVNEKIRVEELKNERQLMSMKNQYKKFREAVLRATQDNTELLQRVAELSQRQFKLEKALNASGGQLHVNDRGPVIKNEMEERNRLVQLVKLQAKEVDALKAEVNMLRRKGGHVYTPAVAPQPAPQAGPEV